MTLRMWMVRKDYDKKTQRWIKKQVPARIVEFVNAVAVELQTEVKKITPVDTEFLRSQWKVRLSTRLQTPAQIFNDTYYAEWVEYGTSRFTGRFFMTATIDRAPSIAARVLRRFQRGRA